VHNLLDFNVKYNDAVSPNGAPCLETMPLFNKVSDQPLIKGEWLTVAWLYFNVFMGTYSSIMQHRTHPSKVCVQMRK